jgi:hypothetical protein
MPGFDTGQTAAWFAGLMQLNTATEQNPYHFEYSRLEVIMTALPEPAAALVEQSAADAAMRITKANEQALDFMFGAQKMMLEEMMFAGKEMLDRARTETHLLSEVVSKVAGSHSVKDLRTMWQACGQHQIDFVRRDSERLFKHGQRMIEATSKPFGNRPQN